jgi:curli biogenesis system outer membrane secretion channel CsgG
MIGKSDFACSYKKKFFSKFLTLAVLVIALFAITGSTGVMAAENKIRIAVLEFEQGRYQFDSDKLTYRVESSLIQDGNFDVISSKKVREAAAELHLPDSGFVNTADAMKLGENLGADLILMGEVSDFSVDRSSFSPGVSIGRVRVGRIYSVTVKFVLTGRLIGVHSGQQIFSENFEGNSHRESPDVGYSYVDISLDDPDPDSMAQKVQKEALGKLTAKVKQVAPAAKTAVKQTAVKQTPVKQDDQVNGYILGIEKDQIITDLGKSSKVAVGMAFSVYELKSWTHPQSGKKITEKVKTAKIKIIRINENTSVAEITEGSPSDIKAGMTLVQE